MNSFPLFHKLNDKHCLIVGGGKVSLSRAETLSKSGVCIDIVSPEISDALLDIVDASKGHYYQLTFDECLRRNVLVNKSYFIIMAATDKPEVNVEVYQYAKEANILVNVASDQSLCDFIFPAIIERDPILIAVSNNGFSPVLTRLLKEKIELIIPKAYGDLSRFLGKYRETIKKIIPNAKKRVSFLEHIAKGSIAKAVLSGKVDIAEGMMQEKLSSYHPSLNTANQLEGSKTDFSPPLSYTEDEKSAVYKVIAERRDMRHFTNDSLDEKIFTRILAAAHMAPSVGLMQPWRFIRITDISIRRDVFQIVDKERLLTANALDTRKGEFLKLKVEGILQCAELVVAALPDKREQHIFGRRTLPEMDLASLSCAIQNMWLAARAEGIGLGWVSLFEPEVLMHLLNMPKGSWPVAILCIGHVDEFYEKPMLVMENWATEKPLEDMIFENSWQEPENAN